MPLHAILDECSDGDLAGSVCNFTCAFAFDLHGNASLACLDSGTWSAPGYCAEHDFCVPSPCDAARSTCLGIPIASISSAADPTYTCVCLPGLGIETGFAQNRPNPVLSGFERF